MMSTWRTRLLLLTVALLAIAAGEATAQTADDLPAAPSEAVKAKAPQQSPAPPTSATPVSHDASAPSPGSDTSSKNAGSNNQQPSQSIAEEPPIIITNVNEVSMVFTVTDKHNHYIKDLSRGDFKILDDEKPVEEIRSFRRETNLPLQVGLLIDASNSVRDRFKFEQESAIEFLNQTIRPKYDQAFVLGFDVTAEVTQDFTDNSADLARGVRDLRPGNATAMYDALFYACRDKLLKSPQTSSVRRAIVLVTDGDDNASHVTREEAIEMALRANVIVYTISTNFPSSGESDQFDKILERIADATGGRSFRPFRLTDVANAFAQIQDDLRSQYALSYRPVSLTHDGRYRPVAILADRKGLKVHSRPGYYAPAE